MTDKVYTKGSELPPLAKEKLRLYSMNWCPFAHRVRIVLAHKHIPYEIINIDTFDKPEWIAEKNPHNEVPILEKDDAIIYGSIHCCKYLDMKHPEIKLTSDNAFLAAVDDMVVEDFCVKWLSTDLIMTLAETKGKDQASVKAAVTALETMEKNLGQYPRKYFGGDEVCLVDFCLWPWFEMLGVLGAIVPEVDPSSSAYPNLTAWTETMRKLPAVASQLTPYALDF